MVRTYNSQVDYGANKLLSISNEKLVILKYFHLLPNCKYIKNHEIELLGVELYTSTVASQLSAFYSEKTILRR